MGDSSKATVEIVKREDRLGGVCRVSVEPPEVSEKKLHIMLALNKDRDQKGFLNCVCSLSLLILTIPFFLFFVDTFTRNRSGMRIYDFGRNAAQFSPSLWSWLKMGCHFSSIQIYKWQANSPCHGGWEPQLSNSGSATTKPEVKGHMGLHNKAIIKVSLVSL